MEKLEEERKKREIEERLERLERMEAENAQLKASEEIYDQAADFMKDLKEKGLIFQDAQGAL